MNKEIYEFEISRNAEGGVLATAGVKNADTSYRIAGPKAWGGSSTIAKIDISQRDLVEFVLCYAPGAYAEIVAYDQSAAAPQVVADERQSFEAWVRANSKLPAHVASEFSIPADSMAWEAWKAGRAALAVAPVQAQEPVYQVSQPFPADPANTWRDASSDAYDLSHPDRRRILYRAPAQPVVVPDGDTRTAVIKDAVNRFLGWKLPKDFCPDCGISFNPMEASGGSWPIGTSLFTADQAKAMFEHCICAPAAQGDAIPEGWQAAKDAYIKITNSPAYANHEVRYMADHDVMSALDKFFDTSAGAQAIAAAIAAKAAS